MKVKRQIAKIIATAIACTTVCLCAMGQELNCKVTVNSDKVPGSNKKVYATMEKAISDFMNQNKWSDYKFKPEEKIDCSMLITINEVGADEKSYSASLQVQSRRPIYNSAYYSPVINMQDEKFSFEYIEMQSLDYNESQFNDDLTSMLAYYAHLIIGYDLDTYSELGGTEHFRKMEAIVNQAQGKGNKGWKAFDDMRNRYALANNLNDENLKDFRRCQYQYHRLGLDLMSESAEKGLINITEGLKNVEKSNKMRSSCVAITTWIETKRDEVINIFSKANSEQKKTAYTIMTTLDPSQSDKFEEILKP